MVHRRKDRPNEGWRVKLALPKPWDTEVVWQTGLRAKREAQQVDAWIREQVRARPEIIDAILARRFTLQEAWIAYRRGSIDELLAGLSDPALTDAVVEYRPLCRDERALRGLEQLLELAPLGARLSWLDRRTIAQLYAAAEAAGQKPNTVQRGLHRAVRELLTHHIGKVRTRDLFLEVRVPRADDTRHVRITPDELRKTLDRITVERFRWLVVLSICTTADRKPLLALAPEHVDLEAGTLTIPDTKAPDRWRVVRLAGPALVAARLAVAGVARGSRVFDWSPWQVRKMWDAARPAGLRFKDLRHLLPSMLAAQGADRREIEALLGHAPGSTQTGRYITPAGDVARLEAAATALGLDGWHARVG